MNKCRDNLRCGLQKLSQAERRSSVLFQSGLKCHGNEKDVVFAQGIKKNI